MIRREALFRPERYKYVRKIIKPKGCVFCHSARAKKIGLESMCLFKNKLVMVVMNKFPYNTGHLLILPTRHVGELEDLTTAEYNELSRLLRETVRILKKSYGCPGLNIGMNHGAAAGAGIPKHLHWHVVPRWKGDTNFFPVLAHTKVLPETLEQTFNRLLPYFSKVK